MADAPNQHNLGGFGRLQEESNGDIRSQSSTFPVYSDSQPSLSNRTNHRPPDQPPLNWQCGSPPNTLHPIQNMPLAVQTVSYHPEITQHMYSSGPAHASSTGYSAPRPQYDPGLYIRNRSPPQHALQGPHHTPVNPSAFSKPAVYPYPGLNPSNEISDVPIPGYVGCGMSNEPVDLRSSHPRNLTSDVNGYGSDGITKSHGASMSSRKSPRPVKPCEYCLLQILRAIVGSALEILEKGETLLALAPGPQANSHKVCCIRERVNARPLAIGEFLWTFVSPAPRPCLIFAAFISRGLARDAVDSSRQKQLGPGHLTL
ncbi:hypothetical protein PIIN_05613 [Serendipita indica DSM 11827]|uniref:Uncharacterized protein n=1 Tax=Serendipita indica (strain DSM 11827) TaxID=1109443 RepID=G4TK35_SERID|nr:hypothetical protein PIIN_05613 [Serendipita indica DSM 11827]